MAENMSDRWGIQPRQEPCSVLTIDNRAWLAWVPILIAFPQGSGENPIRALSPLYLIEAQLAMVEIYAEGKDM
jgi:hypothetical protein